MSVDFSTCMVFNTRMAARAVTRRYDGLLRPYGLTAAQFSLLGGLRRDAGESLAVIAERNGLDRTSLTRNLGRLEKRGLIATRPGSKGNARLCSLTERGAALIETVTPVWIEAQRQMRELLSEDGFSASLQALQRLGRT